MSGEGKHTRGAMGDADLNLMESGFFEKKKKLLQKPDVFI